MFDTLDIQGKPQRLAVLLCSGAWACQSRLSGIAWYVLKDHSILVTKLEDELRAELYDTCDVRRIDLE